MANQQHTMKRCATCRHWSDRIACMAAGSLRAMCLSRTSYQAAAMTTGRDKCGAWQAGEPVDQEGEVG